MADDNDTTPLLKTLLIPALTSLLLYLLLTHALLPLLRRHRHRYTQYLPMTLLHPSSSSAWDSGTMTTGSGTFGARARDALANFLVPASVRYSLPALRGLGSGGGDGEEFAPMGGRRGEEDEEEEESGEDGEVDERMFGRRGREALDGREWGSEERRLSRDLEAGFRDESSDEDEEEEGERGSKAGCNVPDCSYQQ